MDEKGGLRRRLMAVGALVVLLVASGIGLDRGLGALGASSAGPPGTLTGAWFCPHGGSPGLQGWIVAANPGSSPVRARLTQLTAGRVRSVDSFEVPPLRQVYREVSAQDTADSAVLEFFGGWLGAAAVLRSDGSPARLAAERCEPAPRRASYLLDEPTGPGDTAFVVVMNPFSEDASFDLSVKTEQRTIAPGSLSPYVLPARSSVAFRMNDIALEGPGEHTVAVKIVPRIGRVVAGGLVQSISGIRAEAGGAVPARVFLIPAAGYGTPADLVLWNPGAFRALVSVIASGRKGQRVATGPNEIPLAPGEVRTMELPGLTGAGLVVRSDNRQPISAELRLAGPAGDVATTTGAPSPARAWLVLPPLPPTGGRSFVVLQNPGHTAVRASIQLLGPAGAVAAPRLATVSVPAGRTISVALAPGVGTRAVTALVRAEGGTIVAGSASYSSGGAAYAAMLALPMKE